MDNNYKNENYNKEECFWRGKLTVPYFLTSLMMQRKQQQQQQNKFKFFQQKTNLHRSTSGSINFSSFQLDNLKEKELFNCNENTKLFKNNIDSVLSNNLFKVFNIIINFLKYFY